MEPPRTALRTRIEHLLAVDQESKPKVYLQVFDAAEVVSLNYALELLLSAGIATFGLVLDSPAVVIGAMLISPLMGPILASGLALAAADVYLGIKSLLSVALSVAGAILFAGALVWLLPFQSPTQEILARTQPNLLDLGVALFSGLAGSIVVCRGGGGGGVTALPGVAIAVALMPPLCTVGFGVGSGFSWPIIKGAGLLFLTNLAAIMASAFIVFYAVRMDAPDLRSRIDQSIHEHAASDRLYRLLGRTRAARAFGDIGKLRWRVLMLVATLAALFIPLRQSLYQLREETIARTAANEAVRLLASPGMIFTQQLDVTPERIVLRMIVTDAVGDEKIREAENLLLRRTGKEVTVSVRKVASEEELALLRERFRAPPAPPPPPTDLSSMRAELIGRVEKPLTEVWPGESAPLISWEVGFTSDEVLVRARYKSDAPLDPAAEETLARALRTRLHEAKLRLILEHEAPPTPAIRRAVRR
ncbi:MAG: DUF389 domain-containing protein [Bryobacteraceae bacterium]|nr:DUF389 domain-containing protein [Bryobacteraceae bacterium]